MWEATISQDLNINLWRTEIPKRQEAVEMNPMIVLAYCLHCFEALVKGAGAGSLGRPR